MKTIIPILLTFFMLHSYAQTTFEKSYSGNGNSSGIDIIQTFGGDFLIVANESNLDPAGFNLFLLKIDQIGDTIWTKKYRIPSGTVTRGIQTSDGCYIFTGKTGLNLFLFKVDNAGDSLWFKTYNAGFNYSLGHSLIEANDHSLIVVGEYFFGVTTCCAPLVFRTDSSGELLHDIILTNNNGKAYEIVETSDHNLVISSSVIYGPPVTFLTKINLSGTIIWQKEYPGNCECNVSLANDDGFVISGKNATTLNPYLIKTDSEGEIVWNRSNSPFSIKNENLKVAQADDAGFLMVGGTYDMNSDLNLLKISYTGDSLWQRYFGGDGDDFGNTVIATTDNGFAAVGYSTVTMGDARKVYLVKTDSLGLITFSRTYDLHKTNITISPNPFIESITLSSNLHMSAAISISDISGVPVFSGYWNGTQKIIDLNLPKGIFIVHVQSVEGTWTGKIIRM